MTFDFLIETYATERLKTLSVWSHFQEADLDLRPADKARTPREQMVHQCLSEDGWFSQVLGIDVEWPKLPAQETRMAFLDHYAEASNRRLQRLRAMPAAWFEEGATFFAEPRSRAWVLVRRIAHSAHHRGQLTTHLRLLGRVLYSTYGPTADTGGLPANGALVVYRYPTSEELLESERGGGTWPTLPGPGKEPVTERP
ncbi:MAG TPA: DinB family protein [Gemmatimonadales bacterium]|nr:DinB family protein [Gemmatimonadales bacterium]